MKKTTLFALTLLTGAALALPAAQALAAGTETTSSATAKKKHKKVAAKKATTKKVTKKAVRRKTAKAIEEKTPPQTLTERLSDEEQETAKRVYVGAFPCDLGSRVTVTADPANPGFFNIVSGSHHYFMHPVESQTGAVRLEDNRQGAVWLQLGNKSMLMDQKLGQRVADDCEANEQRDFIAHSQGHPQTELFQEPASAQQTPASAQRAPASVPQAPASAQQAPASAQQAPASAQK